jgi:hypothetical protein
LVPYAISLQPQNGALYSGITTVSKALGNPSLLPSLFGEGSQCTGFSISYSLTVALVGGTVPLVAAWMLGEVGWSWGPGLYCALWAIPSLWALKGLKNP